MDKRNKTLAAIVFFFFLVLFRKYKQFISFWFSEPDLYNILILKDQLLPLFHFKFYFTQKLVYKIICT